MLWYRSAAVFSIFVCLLVFSFVIRGPRAQADSCPCSIWSDAATPVNPAANDNQPIETGVKLRSDIAGFITAVRFYKGALNTGIHTAHLWSSAGVMLAEAGFGPETASGWQQVALSPPVAVTANTSTLPLTIRRPVTLQLTRTSLRPPA